MPLRAPAQTHHPRARVLALIGVLLPLSACSPALDWREVPLASGQLVGLFPCKPSRTERPVPESKAATLATLQVCDAQGMTFAALSLPAPDGRDVEEALTRLIDTAPSRWGSTDEPSPGTAAAGLPSGTKVSGRRYRRTSDDGAEILTQALFIAHGGQLMQVSISGKRLDEAAVEAFFSGMRPAR